MAARVDFVSNGSRPCPRCTSRELVDYLVDDRVTVDFCSGCRGIWYDGGELEQLLGEGLGPDTSAIPFGRDEAVGPRCPGCGVAVLRERAVGEGESRLTVLECPRCDGVWLDGGLLERLRVQLRRRSASAADPRSVPSATTAPATSAAAAVGSRFSQRYSFDLPVVNTWALPVAFAVALLLNLTAARVLLYPFQILVHELGHAVTAWLSGRMAVPLPMGITFWSRPSLFVSLLVSAVLVGYGVMAWRERRMFAVGTAVALLTLQACLSWIVSDSISEMWVTFGGIGGELLISTFVVVAFYYRAPDRLRWDFWRFVLLLPAASAFTMQVLLWERAASDATQIPMGSALSATRDGSGDLEKLVQVYGWTVERIVESYRLLAFLCLVVIVLHYVVFFVRTRFLARRRSVTLER